MSARETLPQTAPAWRIPVERVLHPRSVAIVGASDSLDKFGGRIFANVRRHGYAGRLLPINPKRAEVGGLPAWPTIADAPGPVDLAVIAVPGSQLLETVAACAQAGVGACVVITAQLAEFDARGKALQDEVAAQARAHGMRLLGPNCMGLISPAAGLALSSTMTLQHVAALRRGGVGFVSQSGALMGTLFVIGDDHAVGFSHMVSIGNQADLELCDFLDALIEDEATRVICLYVEALKSPRRFVELARRARAAGKPVLAVKAGRSEAGASAARSHTASLAGSYDAFVAACEAAGVLVFDEPEGMIVAAGVFDRLGSPAADGGIGFVGSSGGGCAVTADRLAAAGLPLARWTPATRERLAAHFLPTHANNPIDLGAHKGVLTPQVFEDAIAAVADDDAVAVLLYVMTPQPLMAETADALIAARRRSGKPVLVVSDTGSFAADVRGRLVAAGLPLANRIDDALRVLDAWFRLRRLAAFADGGALRPAGAGPLPAAPAAGLLNEPDTKALLAAYGIWVNAAETVTGAEAAVAAAGRIGHPVVLKGVSRSITHKSDAGLVRLGLADADAVRAAWAALAGILRGADGDAPPRVSVQQQVAGVAELILGVRHDADFGPQLLVGFGGVLVEVLKDFRLAAVPLSPAAARALLDGLRLRPLLDGVRGAPAADVDAVVDAIVRLSWLAADLGDRLRELDVNPLIVGARGKGAVAVDGRALIAEQGA